jgi:putative transcriptional regulator
MTETEIHKGHILIAEPFMLDPHFRKAVVLLCEHSAKDGSIGFILNKMTNVKVEDLISDFPECEAFLFYGGPVGQDTIHFIHRQADLIPNSKEIIPGLFWGGDFEIVKFLIETKVLTPMDIKFFIGYSGWTSGQLREELETVSWVLDEMDINYAFTNKINQLWNLSMENKGNHFRILAEMSDMSHLN